jgi:hypothetical protein
MKNARAVGILVASGLFVAACGSQEPVTLRTGSAECNDGIAGDLAFDPGTGSITLDEGRGPKPVQWPTGYTGRRSGSQVEILNRSAKVLYRTGTRVTLVGDPFRSDGVLRICGMEIISVPSPGA